MRAQPQGMGDGGTPWRELAAQSLRDTAPLRPLRAAPPALRAANRSSSSGGDWRKRGRAALPVLPRAHAPWAPCASGPARSGSGSSSGSGSPRPLLSPNRHNRHEPLLRQGQAQGAAAQPHRLHRHGQGGPGAGLGRTGGCGRAGAAVEKSRCRKSPSTKVNVCHRILVAESLRCFLAVSKPKCSSKYVWFERWVKHSVKNQGLFPHC